jgi:hypothetical protein
MKQKNPHQNSNNTPVLLAFTALISSLNSYVQAALEHGKPT